MNLLKILPLNKRRLDVLFEIYAEGQDYLRSISKKLNMNPSLAFNILNRLYDAKLVIKKKIGKEVQYSLNNEKNDALVIKLLEEYNFEKIVNKTRLLKTIISLLISNKQIINYSYKIYLFGSYILGDYTKNSDIDILFVNDDKKAVGRACREISLIAGKNLNPLIYTRKKFKADLSKNEPMLCSIINNVRNRIIIK